MPFLRDKATMGAATMGAARIGTAMCYLVLSTLQLQEAGRESDDATVGKTITKGETK